MSLPAIREELALLPGPVMPDGQPSWTLHDPARDQFFRIDWPTFEMLSRWPCGDAGQIVEAINRETTLHLDVEAVAEVAAFLAGNELIERADAGGMATRLHALNGTPWQKFIHNYLFFRVPLWRPDAWLERWLPLAKRFQTRGFLLASLFVLLADIWLVSRQSQEFFGTLVDTLSPRGFLFYALAVMAIKFLHELGHAFTAKRHGCKVPAMGVAFMVLWPVAYTDTNAVWRLTDRWQRLRVASAGIAVELVVAIWATLAWALLPPGSVRSAAYFLATTSWVTTLIINASPFMRFDGYFILSDLLDMPNLHARSFALARWRLREWLFRLNEPAPEHFARPREWALILFAVVTWLYRLVVFLGIAALVYHFAVKLVGIVLFGIEIYYFIFLPIARETAAWAERLPAIRANPASLRHVRLVLAGVASLLVLLLVPLPSTVTASGLLQPAQTWEILAPEPSQLVQADLVIGRMLAPGDPVVRLQAGDLEMQQRVNAARVTQMSRQASAAGMSEETRKGWQADRERLAAARREAEAILVSRDRLDLRAPFAGRIGDAEPGLVAGQWVRGGEKLGVGYVPGRMVVETYLDEADIRRVQRGNAGRFISDGGEGALDLEVIAVDADATRALPDGMLTTPAGGHIAVRVQDGRRIPDQAIYRVVLAVRSSPGLLADRKWRGKIVIDAAWTPLAAPFVNQALGVLMREAGF